MATISSKHKTFVRVPNAADGDCLFHSISQALMRLYKREKSPKHLRKKIVEYLCKCSTSKDPSEANLWARLKSNLGILWQIQDCWSSSSGKILQKCSKWTDLEFKCYYKSKMGYDAEGTILELEAAAKIYNFQASYFMVNERPKDSLLMKFEESNVEAFCFRTCGSENLPNVYFIHTTQGGKNNNPTAHWEFMIPLDE